MAFQEEIERQVLVVDDEPVVTSTLSHILTASNYSCRTAHNAERALVDLRRTPAAVVIADINMPGKDGIWLLHELERRFPDTVTVMLSGDTELDTAVRCLREGAADFIPKPVRPDHLLTTVSRAIERRRLVLENRAYQRDLEVLVRKATGELREAYREISTTYDRTLRALCSALDAREEETADHSQRVTALTMSLAAGLRVSEKEMEHIARGALLHDIGKIGVPDQILLKPARLTEDEWRIMRRHPAIGQQILAGIDFLGPAAEMVLHHHERFDGGGYPQGLAREDISLGARIFAVADTYDAITSNRPYRAAAHPSVAFVEINRCAGAQFDPRVVSVINQLGERGVEGALNRSSFTAAARG